MPWQHNGKTHWFLDKFEGFSLWVSKKNNKYEESLSFAKTLADQLMESGLKFTTHHDELTNTAKYGRIAPLVDRERGIYDASDHIAVLYELHMPTVLVEAGMIVNALKSKCSRLQRAARLSPERSLQQWSDFAPGGHKLDDLLTSRAGPVRTELHP